MLHANSLLQNLQDQGWLLQCPGFSPPGPDRPLTHIFSSHRPVWAYCRPDLARPYAANGPRRDVFRVLPVDAALEVVAEHTGCVCFLGAAWSETFSFFHDATDAQLLVVEPEKGPLLHFLEHRELRPGVRLLWGDWESLETPLSHLLGVDTEHWGFPAFYYQPGMSLDEGAPLAAFRERLEMLFYRWALHPLILEEQYGALPLRPMQPGLIFDHQKHVYENLNQLGEAGDFSLLANSLQGETALLIGAGPQLNDMLDYVREAQDRAVVIAVNSALRPLLAAGVEPHFAIVFDGTLPVEATLQALPANLQTMLVGNICAYWGEGSFARIFPYGPGPAALGRRPDLRSYGSVLTAAWSLAGYLGCGEAVLAGFQLSSPDPWSLSYARGTLQESWRAPRERPLCHAFPQLYPVRSHDGRKMYTTLDFYDVALWMSEQALSESMRTVNATPDSIIYGSGIDVSVNHPVTGLPGVGERVQRLCNVPAVALDSQKIGRYIQGERRYWQSVRSKADGLLQGPDVRLVPAAAELVERWDQDRVSRQLCSFPEFDNGRFSADVLAGREPARVHRGYLHYLRKARDMADEHLRLLQAANER